MEVTAQLIQNHLRTTMERLMPLLSFANAPMVKFLTENLWEHMIPPEIQHEIETPSDIQSAVDIFWSHLNEESFNKDKSDKFKHFRAFLANNRQNHLDNLRDVWITPEKLKQIFDTQRSSPLPIKGFMSTKKNHEVIQFLSVKYQIFQKYLTNFLNYLSLKVLVTADLIANMCAPTKDQKAFCVIDAGDGKGYLSTRLSLEYNIKVLGVDCNPVNTRGAILRSEKLEVKQ